MTRLFAATALALLLACPADAMEFARKGAVIALAGKIRTDDQFVVLDYLKKPENAGVRYIALASGGGSVNSAIEIARYIRTQGMETIVDGARANCSSACTILFGGGVKRHYINAGSVKDGASAGAGTGLGFHQATTSLSQNSAGFSGAGTAMVIGAYHELGIANAADLADKAPPNMIYRLSGTTALSMGIATSLTVP